MGDKLSQVLLNECYARVQSLQLSKADLPHPFEMELTQTNVAQQDALTQKANQRTSFIEAQTNISNSITEAPSVINKAKGDVAAKIATNKAAMEAFAQVTLLEAQSYGELKRTLKFGSDDSFLEYVKMKTIGKFNKKNLLIAEAKPKPQVGASKADPADKVGG